MYSNTRYSIKTIPNEEKSYIDMLQMDNSKLCKDLKWNRISKPEVVNDYMTKQTVVDHFKYT